MAGKSLPAKYDGYTSCPLVISPKECILAEFDFQVPPQPLETLPINQAKPSRLSYMMKSHLMPQLYWTMMLKYVYKIIYIFIFEKIYTYFFSYAAHQILQEKKIIIKYEKNLSIK